MQLGMIGLGRMGGNMAKRLEQHGHEVKRSTLRSSRREDARRSCATSSTPAHVLDDGPGRRDHRKDVPGRSSAWLSRATWSSTAQLDFHDSQRRYAEAKEHGIKFVDAGVSGGIWGLTVGYCLMVGGDDDAVSQVEPAFSRLRRKTDTPTSAPRAPATSRRWCTRHRVRPHAGLRRGLRGPGEVGVRSRPPRDRRDLAVRLRRPLLACSELLHSAFEVDGPHLEKIRGYVEDSGEGRWTIAEAIAEDVPVPVITAALFARFASRQEESFAAKVNAALRNQFGGHAVRAVETAQASTQDPR